MLRKALWQVRPRLAVCGRIREARGVEKVQWQLGQDYPPFLEGQITQIDYPNTEAEAEAEASKWSFLDMTRLGPDPLLNNGASGQQLQQGHVYFSSENRARLHHSALSTTMTVCRQAKCRRCCRAQAI